MEEEKVDSMFMENLEEWILEENKVVTYKYLSKSIKVHVNVAKQMLYNFVQEQISKGNKNLGIVYLVSGFMKSEITENSKLKVVLIKEKDLEIQIKTFDKVLTKHIYSVQSHEKISSTSVYATDMMSVREDINSCNTHNAIKNKAAVPRPSEVYVPPTKKEVVKQEVKKETKVVPTIENKKKSPAKKSPPSKKEDTKKSSATVKKGGNSIASMFAKQSAAAASKPPVIKPKEELASKTSPGKENMENARLEEQKKDGSGEKKAVVNTSVKNETKTAKNNKKSTGKAGKKSESSNKRKRIQVESDSDESENEEDNDEAAAESDTEGPPRARIIESDEETEEIPSTPQPAPNGNGHGRRKVRKEVDKTYIDEKGFMVTKKEYVYESEDEEPPQPQNQAKPEPKKTVLEPKKASPPAADKKSSGPAAKKAKLMAGATKQPGIMNFFKKK